MDVERGLNATITYLRQQRSDNGQPAEQIAELTCKIEIHRQLTELYRRKWQANRQALATINTTQSARVRELKAEIERLSAVEQPDGEQLDREKMERIAWACRVTLPENWTLDDYLKAWCVRIGTVGSLPGERDCDFPDEAEPREQLDDYERLRNLWWDNGNGQVPIYDLRIVMNACIVAIATERTQRTPKPAPPEIERYRKGEMLLVRGMTQRMHIALRWVLGWVDGADVRERIPKDFMELRQVVTDAIGGEGGELSSGEPPGAGELPLYSTRQKLRRLVELFDAERGEAFALGNHEIAHELRWAADEVLKMFGMKRSEEQAKQGNARDGA